MLTSSLNVRASTSTDVYIQALMGAAPEGQADLLADAGVDGDGHGQVHGAAGAEAAHRVGPHRRPCPVSTSAHARDAVILHVIVEIRRHRARIVLLARGLDRADVIACAKVIADGQAFFFPLTVAMLSCLALYLDSIPVECLTRAPIKEPS
jgi:hypothetical protein